MPDLTPKQEAFVGAYIETGNATEAYRRSYSAANMTENALNVEAHRVLNNPKVALRLQVLQERAAAKVVLSRSWVLEQLMDNATKAKGANDFNASNKALELLGKTDEIGGMFTDRQSVQSDNRNHHSFDPVSAFDGFLAEASGSRAKVDPEKPVQN